MKFNVKTVDLTEQTKMSNAHGEIHICECPTCGHKHKISEREIGLYQGMVKALWSVFKWCEQKGRHEFQISEVKDLIGKNEYARFGDWKKFGGLVYTPIENGKSLGKGHYGLNLPRCDEFFKGTYKIPSRVWKKPLNGELEGVDYKTIHEIPKLSALLNADNEYIARYRVGEMPRLF